MKHRYRLYLETSFWNRLGDRTSWDRRKASYRFLHRACMHQEILVSPLVLQEVRRTPDLEERQEIERQMRNTRTVMVSGTRRANVMAHALRDEGGLGERLLADLVHVSYAIMGSADALVTWDRRTLARDVVRAVTQVYCRRESLTTPLIGLPEEVTQWLGLRM